MSENRTRTFITKEQYQEKYASKFSKEGESLDVLAEPIEEIVLVVPTEKYPDDKRWNYHTEQWEVRKYNHQATLHGEVRRRLKRNEEGKVVKITLGYTPSYDDWKRDEKRMQDKTIVDDKHFVQTYLGLWDDETSELKNYASLAYLAKKWCSSVSNIKRQRTRINKAVQKHFPKKIVLPSINVYTQSESEHLKSQKNEHLYNNASADDFLAAFGLDMDDLHDLKS